MKANPVLDRAAESWRPAVSVKLRRYVFPIPDFPLGVYPSGQQTMLDVHTHENFSELVFVSSGCGVHCIGDRRYNIQDGDVFVVRGDVPHYYSDGCNLMLVNIVFNWEELHLPMLDIGEIGAFQRLFIIDPADSDSKRFSNRVRLSCETFNELYKDIVKLGNLLKHRPYPAGIRFLALTQFQMLLIKLLNAYVPVDDLEELPQSQQRLGELAAMLERDYALPIPVSTMCRKAGMSYATLFRQFRQFYKDTPVNYQIRQRLRHASQMLSHRTDLPVAEIAQSCGFKDLSYFARKFKEYYQLSPTAYRKCKTGNH